MQHVTSFKLVTVYVLLDSHKLRWAVQSETTLQSD